MSRMLSTAAILISTVQLAYAQGAPTVQPNLTICNWAGLRSGTIRDTIYLDGGSLWWQSGTTNTGDPITTNDGGVQGIMYSLNLSYPFDTTEFNQTTSLLQPISKTGGNAANNIAPNYEGGAMFVNDGELILYGGLEKNSSSDLEAPSPQAYLSYEAYQYGPERTTWSSGTVQNTVPKEMNRFVTNGGDISVPGENLGFYFSGLRGKQWGAISQQTNDWILADTLVKVDSSTMRSEKWSNFTLPDDVIPRAGAELIWIPVGGQGALVAIGGTTSVEYLQRTNLSDDQLEDIDDKAPGFLTSLPVFDIVSETWYMQKTTGKGPEGPLTEFCTVVAPAKDASSFNIYVFGGYDGLKYTSLPNADVWILSLPSFIWVKASSGVASRARRGHKCEKVYPDQMFVIGGVNPTVDTCVEDGIVQIFNLNTLSFQNLYNPREWAEYAVPDVVIAEIGGDRDGGATKTAKFSETALASLFKTPYTKEDEVYYPYSPASGTPGSTPLPTPVPNNGGGGGLPKWAAAVLGVVLGLVFITVIAAAILIYRRRRLLRRKNSVGGSMNGGSSTGYPNPILKWVTSMSHAQDSSEGKGGSVTSTDDTPDRHFSGSTVGMNEAQGRERFQLDNTEKARAPIAEKVRAPIELPTEYNHQTPVGSTAANGSSRNQDFAYTSTKASSSQPGDYPDPNTAISPSDAISPSTAISPQSPESFNNIHNYLGSSIGNNTDAATHASTSPREAPSPLQRAQHHPDTSVSARSVTSSPSPEPHIFTQMAQNASTDVERRPSHTRNVSSLSEGMPTSPNSPSTVVSPDDATGGRNSRYVSGLSMDQDRLGALDAVTGEGKGDGTGLQRKKTAEKKSSFNEMMGNDKI